MHADVSSGNDLPRANSDLVLTFFLKSSSELDYLFNFFELNTAQHSVAAVAEKRFTRRTIVRLITVYYNHGNFSGEMSHFASHGEQLKNSNSKIQERCRTACRTGRWLGGRPIMHIRAIFCFSIEHMVTLQTVQYTVTTVDCLG